MASLDFLETSPGFLSSLGSLMSNLLTMISRVHAPKRFPVLPSALILFLCLVSPLVAAEKYLTPGKLDSVALLAPPPIPGSPEYKADLASATAVFQGRTPVEEARALKDATLTIFNFAPAIGTFFNSNTLPKSARFFTELKPEIKEAITIPKEHWKRIRPYEVNKELWFGKPEPSFSYPSGHSTQGMIQALVLCELFPEKRDAIMEIGRNIGWDRVLIGKHFPTDVIAGRVLAQAVMRELKESAAFQKDLAEVKAEIESVKALAANKKAVPASK
ncbi:MAG: hypothetical protein JWM68_4931 [Verrucomicrobiales bacterium]|nr:hypothetical protein [Verrucomicrobiales bacterium]